MLINHDSVFFQGSIAIAVKFLGKEPFRMAKWICRIVDDDVVIIFTVSQKSQSILVVNGNARIIKSCSKIWEVFSTNLNQHLIWFHDIDLFQFRIKR